MAKRDIPRYIVGKAPPTTVEHMVFDEKTQRFERVELVIKDGYMVRFPASRNKHSIFFETKALLDDFIKRDDIVSDNESSDDENVKLGSEMIGEPSKAVKTAAG